MALALDGDADRLIMCDETGQVIDGDQLLGLMAVSWKTQGRLSKDGIVATIMSNLGLEHYLKSQDIALIRNACLKNMARKRGRSFPKNFQLSRILPYGVNVTARRKYGSQIVPVITSAMM